KDTLIQYRSRPSDRINVYDLVCYKGPYNTIQYGKNPFSHLNNNVYKAEISHDQIEGISDLIISINLPEIKGYGKVNFNKYFAFALIKKFNITIGKNLIITTTGQELLKKYLIKCTEYEKNIFEKTMSNESSWLKYRYGRGPDFIIYEKKTIDIPLKFYFDESVPYSILRIPKGNTIIFDLELNSIKNVINYNQEFKDKSLDNILEVFNPFITMREYNTIEDLSTDKYYIQYEENI